MGPTVNGWIMALYSTPKPVLGFGPAPAEKPGAAKGRGSASSAAAAGAGMGAPSLPWHCALVELSIHD